MKLPPVEQSEIVLLSESRRPGWRLYAANLAEGCVLVWYADIAPEERAELLATLDEVAALPPLAAVPEGVSREVALRLDTEPVMDLGTARQIARPLTSNDQALILASWPDEPELSARPEWYQAIGVIVAGRLLCLAHSSRRTAEACELGIETLPEARRRGYALAATVAWSATIKEEGLTPIYSARADNTASLNLARATGYREFARATLLD